jgi:hypothetical protein
MKERKAQFSPKPGLPAKLGTPSGEYLKKGVPGGIIEKKGELTPNAPNEGDSKGFGYGQQPQSPWQPK